MKILLSIATRPNPTISLGPVDFSSSFVVVDAKKPDFPLMYVSESFERLTGYKANEIIGMLFFVVLLLVYVFYLNFIC
jgi:hypothetical protein